MLECAGRDVFRRFDTGYKTEADPRQRYGLRPNGAGKKIPAFASPNTGSPDWYFVMGWCSITISAVYLS